MLNQNHYAHFSDSKAKPQERLSDFAQVCNDMVSGKWPVDSSTFTIVCDFDCCCPWAYDPKIEWKDFYNLNNFLCKECWLSNKLRGKFKQVNGDLVCLHYPETDS